VESGGGRIRLEHIGGSLHATQELVFEVV